MCLMSDVSILLLSLNKGRMWWFVFCCESNSRTSRPLSVSLSHFSISSFWRHTKDWDYIMCLSTKIPEKPIFRNYWTFWFCFQTWHLFFLLSLCGVWGDKWWSHCREIVSIVAVVSSAVIRLKCPHTDCTSLLHFTYFPLSSHSTRWK